MCSTSEPTRPLEAKAKDLEYLFDFQAHSFVQDDWKRLSESEGLARNPLQAIRLICERVTGTDRDRVIQTLTVLTDTVKKKLSDLTWSEIVAKLHSRFDGELYARLSSIDRPDPLGLNVPFRNLTFALLLTTMQLDPNWKSLLQGRDDAGRIIETRHPEVEPRQIAKDNEAAARVAGHQARRIDTPLYESHSDTSRRFCRERDALILKRFRTEATQIFFEELPDSHWADITRRLGRRRCAKMMVYGQFSGTYFEDIMDLVKDSRWEGYVLFREYTAALCRTRQRLEELYGPCADETVDPPTPASAYWREQGQSTASMEERELVKQAGTRKAGVEDSVESLPLSVKGRSPTRPTHLNPPSPPADVLIPAKRKRSEGDERSEQETELVREECQAFKKIRKRRGSHDESAVQVDPTPQTSRKDSLSGGSKAEEENTYWIYREGRWCITAPPFPFPKRAVENLAYSKRKGAATGITMQGSGKNDRTVVGH